MTKQRGISLSRKANLISKLQAIIPNNRMKLWEELAMSETDVDLEDETN